MGEGRREREEEEEGGERRRGEEERDGQKGEEERSHSQVGWSGTLHVESSILAICLLHSTCIVTQHTIRTHLFIHTQCSLLLTHNSS